MVPHPRRSFFIPRSYVARCAAVGLCGNGEKTKSAADDEDPTEVVAESAQHKKRPPCQGMVRSLQQSNIRADSHCL